MVRSLGCRGCAWYLTRCSGDTRIGNFHFGAEDSKGSKLGVKLGSVDGSRLGTVEMLGLVVNFHLVQKDSEGVKLGVKLGAVDKMGC